MNQLTPEQSKELYEYIHHVFIGSDHFNEKHTAYGLKQPFSRKHFYVTTQQFIEAMQDAGFRMQRIHGDDAYFNISDYSHFEDL